MFFVYISFSFVLSHCSKMSKPTHPLLTLVEQNKNCLKSMLTHYIDATVDNQFASLRNSILKMIQSGQIGPHIDVTAFGTFPTQANTDQSSAQCWNEYSNDTLTRAQEHQNILQNYVPLASPINSNDQIIKQEFEEMNEDEEKFDDDNVKQECLPGSSITSIPLDFTNNAALNDISIDEQFEAQNTQIQTDNFEGDDCYAYLNQDNCANGVCNLDHENNSNHLNNEVTARDENETNLIEAQFQIDASASNNPQEQNNLQNEVSLSNTIKQEFDDEEENGEEIDDDSVAKCEKGICTMVHENFDNTFEDNSENEDKASDEPQPANYSSMENNQTNESIISNSQQVMNAIDDTTENIELLCTSEVQVNDKSDHLQNVHTGKSSDRSVNESSTSGVRSSTCRRIQTKVFGDAQLDVNPRKSGKRKCDQAIKSVKRVKRKQVLDDDEDTDDNDDQGDHANNAIGESIATECITNPIQPNLAQPNRHLQCSLCLKSFISKYKLQIHLRGHTGERPFQCDLCDKRFKERHKLTRHQLIHQNIKRFRCHECEKQFTLKQHLDYHLLIHSGDRPFECRHCDMSFTASNHRSTHEQAIHLHVKPFRCKQCGHTATQRTNIIQHIRVVHFGLPRTIEEQRALNIVDERDPRELVEKV